MFKARRKQAKGFASIEMVIIAPLMLIVAMGIFELTQLLQANSIVVNVSREGASLISRSSTETPQEVMDIVASTSSPIDLSTKGAIYISLVVGRQNQSPYLSQQIRWNQSGLTIASQVWSSCGSWQSNGECNLGSPKPALSNFPIALDDSEIVYVVEVFYDYDPVSTFVFDSSFTIGEVTYL
ncbi:TPA: pilus assembly protein [Vibrio harveyi]|nr:pilus assembly protein [Vibrio harveyi]